MIDKYGKELINTITFESNDKLLTEQKATLSTEAGIDDYLTAIYTMLLGIGWQEVAILEGMVEFARGKMNNAHVYNEYDEGQTRKQVIDEVQGNERFDLRQYAKEHPLEQGEGLVNVNDFINSQLEKEKGDEDY